jgi:ankyrin repeat protein
LFDAHPEIGDSNIHVAATVADRGRVRGLLESDPSLARGEGGPYSWTPLFCLAYARHDLDVDVHAVLDTASALLEHGADVNARFADGRTPSETAARNGNDGLVRYLASRGAAEPDAVDRVDAFVGAALAADRTAIVQLRTADPDVVETVRVQRPSLIVWAAANRRPDAVALLAELGFDVNARGRGDVPVEQSWETALHQAVANGDQPMAELLLSLGADPDVHDTRFDSTPLGWARHFDQPALVELLEPIRGEVIDE